MNWQINIQDKIKIIRMSDGKANAIDLQFQDKMNSELNQDGSFKGVIITGDGGFFSAGLNIVNLLQSDRETITKTLIGLMNLFQNIMTHPLPFIAIVNGHAVAGGCMLALSCDYRIGIPGKYKMGVNELALGVDLPPMALAALRKCVPVKRLFEVTALGNLYQPNEAVEIGFLNVLEDEESAMSLAMDKMKHLTYSPEPFQRLKNRLIQPELHKIKDESDSIEEFVDQWYSAETRAKVTAAVEKLK